MSNREIKFDVIAVGLDETLDKVKNLNGQLMLLESNLQRLFPGSEVKKSPIKKEEDK